MSLAIGVVSNSKSMGFDDKGNEVAESSAEVPETHHAGKMAADEDGANEGARSRSESSTTVTEDEDDDEEKKIELGPQCTLKEQLEKDKVGSVYLFSTLIEVCSLLPLCSFVWFC